MPIRALIADDEPLSRAHIRSLLQDQGVDVVAETDNPRTVVALVQETLPDVVLLDIEMPGMNGLQLSAALAGLPKPPLEVFVTGYSEYAVQAFEREALDYLLKPVSPERLAATLHRVSARLNSQKPSPPSEPTEQPKMLPLRGKSSIKFLPVDQIKYAESRNGKVMVVAEDETREARLTLTQMEKMLPKEKFMRIHAACIVDLTRVRELLYYGNKTYAVRLDGNVELPVSRTVYPVLAARLGLNRA